MIASFNCFENYKEKARNKTKEWKKKERVKKLFIDSLFYLTFYFIFFSFLKFICEHLTEHFLFSK